MTHAGELSVDLKTSLKPSLQITEFGSIPLEICFKGESCEIVKKRVAMLKEIEKEGKEREEEFIKKYGPESQWSDEVKEMFDNFDP